MAAACGTAPREDRRYHNQGETGNGETCGEGDAEQSVDEAKHYSLDCDNEGEAVRIPAALSSAALMQASDDQPYLPAAPLITTIPLRNAFEIHTKIIIECTIYKGPRL